MAAFSPFTLISGPKFPKNMDVNDASPLEYFNGGGNICQSC